MQKILSHAECPKVNCSLLLANSDLRFEIHLPWLCRWEKYQSEEEAALGRGKRQRKAVSYREAYAPHPSETLSEVLITEFCFEVPTVFDCETFTEVLFFT